MGFEELLGNERLRENLSRSIERGRISHFYLICGPKGAGKHTLARILSAAILCNGQTKPCGSCNACRKVMGDTHPDMITVTDPEHKNVAVKIVREIRDDVFIRPNEGSHKIYIFPQELGVEGQNALLKVLEEPPAYGVFMILTDNPEKLLPTIRSRCTELVLNALPQNLLRDALRKRYPQAEPAQIDAAVARCGGYLGQAMELMEEGAQDPHTEQFVKSFANRDTIGLLQVLVPMEKWKRDQVIPTLERWVQKLNDALLYRSGISVVAADAQQLGLARSSQEMMEAVNNLKKAITYAQSNVSVAAICGWLSWALR